MVEKKMEMSGHLVEVKKTGDVSLDLLIQRAGVYATNIQGLQRRLDSPKVTVREGHRTKFNPDAIEQTFPLKRGAVQRRAEHLQYLTTLLQDATTKIEKSLPVEKEIMSPKELVVLSRRVIRDSAMHPASR